jgi:hypothetical protein
MYTSTNDTVLYLFRNRGTCTTTTATCNHKPQITMAPYSATTKACQAMASTVAGQRRILKRQESVVQYIRKAVESGVYRTADELATVRKERATGTDDLRVIMQRFRQDIVRGSFIHDYPTEYLILEQHPPIPDPPRTPIKFLRQLQAPPNPMERLTKKYLQRQEQQHTSSSPQRNSSDHGSSSSSSAPASSEEYYRRLLGVQAAASASSSSLAFAADSSLRQKPARVQRAYAAAIAHYQLQRTEDLSTNCSPSKCNPSTRRVEPVPRLFPSIVTMSLPRSKFLEKILLLRPVVQPPAMAHCTPFCLPDSTTLAPTTTTMAAVVVAAAVLLLLLVRGTVSLVTIHAPCKP